MATKKTTTTKKSTKSAGEPKASSSDGPKVAKPVQAGSRQGGSVAADKKKGTRPAKPSAVTDAGSPESGMQSEAILARAEQDVTKLLESLNTQMAAAMHAFEELAAIHRGRGEAVIRTRPLDRATAMFQRLVTEVIDDRLSEMLPTLVGLRLEMDQRAAMENGSESPHAEFFARGSQMLDQVLAGGDVQSFEPKLGDAYDPLIHLAVGETHEGGLAGDVVSQVLQPGFRTARGKVIHAARVKVNRR